MGDVQAPQDDAPKWGDALDRLAQERKDALARDLWEWLPEKATKGQPGPFAREQLNGLEVFWLTICALAGPVGTTGEAEGKLLRAASDLILGLDALHLEGVALVGAHLEGAVLSGAHLENANLRAAHLEGAVLSTAHLEGAVLLEAHLEGAVLSTAHLEGKHVLSDELARLQARLPGFPAVLPPADLRQAVLDPATTLRDVLLGDGRGGSVRVADLRWGGTNLAVVDWTPLLEPPNSTGTGMFAPLGDERAA
jgi:hypothetical protein